MMVLSEEIGLMAGKWESLPQELLYLIARQKLSLLDSFHFSCVCKSWKSVSDLAVLHLFKKKLPLMIVPYNKNNKNRRLGSSVCDDTLRFISLFDNDDDEHKKYEIYEVALPEIADRKILGSSEGWLVTVHENSEVQLLNPMSRVLVHLPPLTTFPDVVGTAVLKEKGLCYLVNEDMHTSPSSEDVVEHDSHHFREFFLEKVFTNADANSTLPTLVMVTYGLGKLAFCRPSRNEIEGEQNRWISCLEGDEGGFQDGAFYKGNFYAVQAYGDVAVVMGLDDSSVPFITHIIQEPTNRYYPHMNYLVESGGELLQVRRYLTKVVSVLFKTMGFMVFKLDFNGPSWVEIRNIGEDCVFVGDNHSFSFSASKSPGCRANCIYFTDNFQQGFDENVEKPYKGRDMGLFNLEGPGVLEPFYGFGSQLIMPPPIWYELEKCFPKQRVTSDV